MAMTGAGLSAAIQAKFAARAWWTAAGVSERAAAVAFADDIGNAVIDYIKANATLSAGSIASGVTAGAATAPVTGGLA